MADLGRQRSVEELLARLASSDSRWPEAVRAACRLLLARSGGFSLADSGAKILTERDGEGTAVAGGVVGRGGLCIPVLAGLQVIVCSQFYPCDPTDR